MEFNATMITAWCILLLLWVSSWALMHYARRHSYSSQWRVTGCSIALHALAICCTLTSPLLNSFLRAVVMAIGMGTLYIIILFVNPEDTDGNRS